MRIWRGIKNHFVPSSDNAYRPRLLHRPWLLFFLAVTLGAEGFLVANLVARQSDQNFLAAVVPAEVIALTNEQREENNLNDVTPNALLAQAAQAKAEDMAKGGYFSHVGPDGKKPWQWISEAGYAYQYAGENLAVRFIDSSDVVNAWMQSPTHRENIVKPVYKEIGIGVAQGLYEGEPATYVVQYFASPLREPIPPTVSAVSAAPQTPAAAPSSAAVAQAPAPEVQGAAVAVTQSNSFTQQVARLLQRAFANPQESTSWILGGVASVLIVVLTLTFFMRMQLQPVNMLASGTMVAFLALSFLAINSRLVEGAPSDQAAGVIHATQPTSVTITPQAESTGYAEFPQVP